MTESAEPVVLPRGVVTFLLTDVVESTRWWTIDGSHAPAVMARQAEIIGAAVAAHGGVRPLEQGEGDSVVAVFERASDALAAAVEAQSALAAEPWDGPAVAVRMAVHSGEAEFQDARTYGGAAIIRCARLRDHARGGQVLVSAAAAEIALDRLVPGASLVPVGETALRGLSRVERVHQLVHEAFASPIAEIGPRAARLGSWPTPLIGRVGERAELSALLDEARLVTIAGAGGAGKTRLAHAVAGDLVGRFSDIVWVELARVTADVAAAVARACGAMEAPGVELVEVFTGFLGAKNVLIALDNCEHLLGPCAALVESVLRGNPRVRVLATSREPLGVSGEVTWRIPSLEVPPPPMIDPAGVGGCDAAALFVDRAQAALPTFVLDDETAVDVAAICRRLDGLPLAIELAAARLRSMTLRAVAAGLDDRFRLLTGGSRTALPRQQALVASVEWSYGLCDEEEQRLLRRLAVFVAPFSVEAAEAIAAEGGGDRLEVFDLVCRLVDKSLVQPAGDRYRLLETIRGFALERARERGELAEVRAGHLRWFTSRAAGWRLDRDILTETVLREIGLESPDLLAALEWSLESESDPEIALLWPLGRHWVVENSFAEVSRVARSVLERFEAGSPGWFAALAPMAEALTMARDTNWIEEARTILASSPAAACDGDALIFLDWSTTSAPGIYSDPHSLSWLESFVELGRREQNPAVECGAAATLAYAYAAAGAVKEADRWCEWLDRRLPADAWARASLSAARGYRALFRCEFDAAWRAVSDRAHRPRPHLVSALIAGLVGVYTCDRGSFEFGLDAFDTTSSSGVYGPWSAVLRAVDAIAAGRLAEARALLEPTTGPLFVRNQSPLNDRLRVQLALAVGDADAARGHSERLRPLLNPATSINHATLPYPAASLHLAHADIAVFAGELREAEESVHGALGIIGADLPLVTVDALELLAVVLAQRHRAADAARLLGAAQAFRDGRGYRFRFPFRRVQIDALRLELDAGELAAGADLTLAEAVTLAQGTRGKRGRPSCGWDSLTPAETRVVELVERGCSNAEIAQQLFMGVSTVKTHLVHVFGKLGLRSRAELAAAAARRERAC